MNTSNTFEELERKVQQLEDENRRLKEALKVKNLSINSPKPERIATQNYTFTSKQVAFTSDWQIA